MTNRNNQQGQGVDPYAPSPLASDAAGALKEAVIQLARRVRYLETLPSVAGGDPGQYAKTWMPYGATQLIPHDTDTLIYFTANEKTRATYITELAAPYTLLTVPSGLPGIYTASAGVVFEGQPEGQRRLWIRVNGEDVLVAMQVDAAGGYLNTELNVSAPDWLEAGYFVSAYVWQNSGGDLEIGQVAP